MMPSSGKAIMGSSDVMGRGSAFRYNIFKNQLILKWNVLFISFVCYLGHPVDCHNDDDISSQSFLWCGVKHQFTGYTSYLKFNMN